MTPARTALFAFAATASLAVAGYGIAQTASPAAAPAAAAPATPADLKPGVYTADSSHTKVTWLVNHGGFSTYSGQFVDVEGDLVVGATPEASTLTVTVPIAKVLTGSAGLNAHLQKADFFDTATHATATFKSTKIAVTGPNTGKVTGDLTIRGVTRPLTLDVTFRKGASQRGRYVIGFDAKGVVKRSEYGVNFGLAMLGDEIPVHIGAEFRTAAPAAAAPAQ